MKLQIKKRKKIKKKKMKMIKIIKKIVIIFLHEEVIKK